MTTLNVGVIDGDHGNLTTHELAEILEAKYALFSQFVDLKFEDIEDALIEDYENQLHALANGLPVRAPFAEAGSKMSEVFRQFLDAEEIVRSGVPGVPTQAALDGRQSRLKNRRGPRRASFEDTLLLRRSLAVWVDNDE